MCDARALVHADRSPNKRRLPLRGEPGDGPLVVEGAHPLRPEEAHARERDRPLVAEADQAASAHREAAVRRRCVHARSWRCWVGPGLLELALLELALLASEGQQMELFTLSWPGWRWGAASPVCPGGADASAARWEGGHFQRTTGAGLPRESPGVYRADTLPCPLLISLLAVSK